MTSFFSIQQKRNTFKVGSAYAIAIRLVITFLVAVPPAFAAEEKELNNTVLRNSVAVLPFENLSPNPDDAYFAVGIHQEILDHLAKIHDISVISRPSVLHFDGTEKTPAEIATEFNVETVMKGNVHYADNRINIAVQHIDASNNKQLWSEEYERDLSDIFAIKTEIVDHITTALGADISTAEQERIEKVPTRSIEAYVFYLKARALSVIIRPGLPDAFYRNLDQAIALDQNFALAHALLASGYGVIRKIDSEFNGLTIEEIEKLTLDHAEQALALNPNLSYAYLAQGFVLQSNWRKPEGKQAFERALQVSPHDVEILGSYITLLLYFGEIDEAIPYAQRIMELAPYSGQSHYRMGRLYLYVNNLAAAADNYRKTIELEPKRPSSHTYLAFIEILLGDNTEALKEVKLAEQLVKK